MQLEQVEKSTVIHYKTIKFNIKIILNIPIFQFFGRSVIIMQELVESTVIHYKTIQFNITKHTQFSIFGALRAQSTCILMKE